MTTEQEKEIIANIPFLQYFKADELSDFIKAGKKHHFKKDEVIFYEGDAGKTMYIILSGTVEIFKQNKQIAIRGSGDYFGEMAMIESKPRSAGARTLEDVLLFEIGQTVFDHYLNSNTKIVKQFLQTISGRCRVDLDIIDTGYLEMYKSEEKYRAIVETISDIVLQIDPEGKITFANSAVFVLGYSPNELIGQSYKILMESGNENYSVEDLLTKRIGPRATSNAEIDFLVNPDSPIQEFIQKMPYLVDAHGIWNVRNDIVMKRGTKKKFMGTLCIARDFTERKSSEDQLKKRKEELEELVNERTRVLEIAKKDADNANMAKTEFLAKVSHELRTPLTVILGFCQLLELSPEISLPDTGKKYLGNIKRASDHLFSLINEVLDLSRIETQNVEVERISFDVQVVIKELVQVITPLAVELNIHLENESEKKGAVFIQGDKTKLRQVLMNLLSNAIKYNKENGKVVIDLKEESGQSIEISITDTGVGIPEKDQWKIFEPFQRLHWEYSSVQGTGIGLTICKRLVELMNGKIGFESEAGKGSRFFVELPSG